MQFKKLLAVSTILATPLLFAQNSAHAASFEITNGQTVTSTQTVGASDTGLVNSGGTIATTGGAAYGINSTGTSTVTNNGTITTNGNAAYGIRNTGTNTVITNNGSITTSGGSSEAINNTGSGATITNWGTITTTNTINTGIQSSGNNSTLTNYGSIITTAPGMRTSATGNTLTNYGTITTTGTNSEGLIAAASGNTLINNGTINVSTTNADGIGTDNGTANNTITNNGIINVSGIADNGIANYSDNSTVTQNGVINMTGTSAIAIQNTSADNTTLILGANSQTGGNIVFNGTANLLQYNVANAGRAGGVATVSGTITGTYTSSIIGTSSLTKGARVVQSGNNVAVVTPDSLGGTEVIAQTVGSTVNIVNNRQQNAVLGIAPAGISSGDSADGRIAWAEAFGSYQERPDDGDSAYSKSVSGGVLSGIDMPENDEGYKAGFFAGGFKAATDIGRNTFRKIDSNGLMAGGYAGKEHGEYYLNGQLTAGFSKNDSNRLVSTQIAKSDYNSYFLSPSLTIMRPYEESGVKLVPSLTVSYTGQYDEGYKETGSSANQNVDARFTNTIGAKAQVAAHLDEIKFESGALTPTLRAGVEGKTMVGNNSVDVSVLGTNMSFDPQGYNENIDGVVGFNLKYTTSENIDIYTDAEAILGLNKGGLSDNYGGVLRAGLRWKF